MALMQGFVDESFREDDDTGYYVLAAAVLPIDRHAELRKLMLAMRGERRTPKLHWNEMDRAQRLAAAKQLADIGEMHVVCVGAPVPRTRQERARTRCLERLVSELHALKIELLTAEARTPTLDARDVTTVQGARYALPKRSRFHVEHSRGADEPLLWIADIVAGVVRARLEGERAPWESLRDHIREITLDTRL